MGSEDGDNPFDDLVIEEGDELPEQEETEPDGGTVEASSEPTREPTPDPVPEVPSSAPDEPAFGFDATVQKPLYARETEAWKPFRMALKEADLELEREFDADEVSKRELHDAALRMVAENPQRVAEMVAGARRRNE